MKTRDAYASKNVSIIEATNMRLPQVASIRLQLRQPQENILKSVFELLDTMLLINPFFYTKQYSSFN